MQVGGYDSGADPPHSQSHMRGQEGMDDKLKQGRPGVACLAECSSRCCERVVRLAATRCHAMPRGRALSRWCSTGSSSRIGRPTVCETACARETLSFGCIETSQSAILMQSRGSRRICP